MEMPLDNPILQIFAQPILAIIATLKRVHLFHIRFEVRVSIAVRVKVGVGVRAPVVFRLVCSPAGG
jgi:hypothetical protein